MHTKIKAQTVSRRYGKQTIYKYTSNMIDLDELDTRTSQREAARVISKMEATSNNIYKFNLEGYNNSLSWYKAAIKWYINEYGDMPSKAGPGKDVTFVIED